MWSRLFVITGAQIRAARGLLNITVAELAERTGLAINTIRRAEATNEAPAMTQANIRGLIKMFEEAGVLFIPADSQGPGVRLKSPEPLPRVTRRRNSVP